MASSSSHQQFPIVDDDQLSLSHSATHRTPQSADERNSNRIRSAELQPPANAFSLTDEEESLQHNKSARSVPFSITDEPENSESAKRACLQSPQGAFSLGDENESFQRVQPPGPFFSMTNSVYDFSDTAALEPVNQQQVLGESSPINQFPNIDLERDCEEPVVSPVSNPEHLELGQLLQLSQNLGGNNNQFTSIAQNIEPNTDNTDNTDPITTSAAKAIGAEQLENLDDNKNAFNYPPPNVAPNTGNTEPIAPPIPPTGELPPSIILQALQQALGLTGESGNTPPAPTNALREALAKPVKNAKDARARRGAIMRFKRAAETAPSTPAQSRDKSNNDEKVAGTKRKLSEGEIEEKRIKNRASVQACRQRKRIRKCELEAESGHYASENRALRGTAWVIDEPKSELLVPSEIEQLRSEATADLNAPKYADL